MLAGLSNLFRSCFGAGSAADTKVAAPVASQRVSVGEPSTARLPSANASSGKSSFKSWVSRTFWSLMSCGYCRKPRDNGAPTAAVSESGSISNAPEPIAGASQGTVAAAGVAQNDLHRSESMGAEAGSEHESRLSAHASTENPSVPAALEPGIDAPLDLSPGTRAGDRHRSEPAGEYIDIDLDIDLDEDGDSDSASDCAPSTHFGDLRDTLGTLFTETKDLTTLDLSRFTFTSRKEVEYAVQNGASLAGVDLRMMDLHAANLEGAKLQGANLDGVNFEGAILKNADLTGASLQHTNLTGANLQGATFTPDSLRAPAETLSGP